MNPSTLIGIVASVVLLGVLLLFTAESPSSYLNLPGLAIVFAGTMAATFISYPLREVMRVFRLVMIVFQREDTYTKDDIRELVKISRTWVKGDTRAVENDLKTVKNPFLRTGIQLLIANTDEEEILDMMRWRIARLKAREHAEAQIFRTMSAYAPAFGMIGTLVGLVNMLDVIDANNIELIGSKMAIALLTTFYGILLSNLLFKPIAVKLERRTEDRLIAMNMVLEGISMLTKRRLPSFVEESLHSFVADYDDEIRDQNARKKGST